MFQISSKHSVVVTLPITSYWLYRIYIGEKKHEYRVLSPYYESRLRKWYGQTIPFRFRAGYSLASASVDVMGTPVIGIGSPEWGAPKDDCWNILISSIIDHNYAGILSFNGRKEYVSNICHMCPDWYSCPYIQKLVNLWGTDCYPASAVIDDLWVHCYSFRYLCDAKRKQYVKG
jgi:hypothetical protein